MVGDLSELGRSASEKALLDLRSRLGTAETGWVGVVDEEGWGEAWDAPPGVEGWDDLSLLCPGNES